MTLRMTALVMIAGLTLVGCSKSQGQLERPPSATQSSPQPAVKQYWCPMHPEVVSTDPDATCEKCGGMKLLPKEPGLAQPQPQSSRTPSLQPAAAAKYHCPMHPTYVSDRPGDCPICNMALVPIDQEDHAPPGESVAGRLTVKLSPEKQQLIGLTTATVQKRVLADSIRTVGRVDYAEPNLAWINTKVMGWIEKLHVDATGQYVKKGETLLEIYSPDLVSAQEEYLIAARAPAGDDSLIRAARRRLELWDITDAQIDELEKTGQVRKTLGLSSPLNGYVIEKTALQGKAVMPGENLYRVADLSKVWIYADIYESEIPRIQAGQAVFLNSDYAPGQTVTGRVSYVYPFLEPQTRTLKVRIEADNPVLALKPEMYVNAWIETAAAATIAVPASAVIDTGVRTVAFVDQGDGRLEPRELVVGLRTDDYWEVKEGLAEGEKVVTRALFLVDAESQLKAAIAGMTHPH